MIDDAIQLRFSAFVELTVMEKAVLHNLHGHISIISAGQVIKFVDNEPIGMLILHRGWALSSVTLIDGHRLIPRVYRSGDIMGASSLPFDGVSTESIVALTPCHVSAVPLTQLSSLFIDAPRLSGVLFLLAQEEYAMMSDRMFSVARLDAKRRIAALLLTFYKSNPSKPSETIIDIPLTQTQLGDMLGLSTVHINRSLSALEAKGLIQYRRCIYDLLDIERLEAFVRMPRRVRHRNAPWLPPALS